MPYTSILHYTLCRYIIYYYRQKGLSTSSHNIRCGHSLKLRVTKTSLYYFTVLILQCVYTTWKTWPPGGPSFFSLYVHCKIFKNLLFKKYRHDLKTIWHKCSLGDLLPILFNLIRSIEKHDCQGRGLFLLYVHWNIFKNLLVQKHLPDLKISLPKCSLGVLVPRIFK